jgi:hypothetical protein
MAEVQLRKEGIEWHADSRLYTVACPSCRVPAEPASLAAHLPALRAVDPAAWVSCSEGSSSTAPAQHAQRLEDVLGGQLAQQVRVLQMRHASVYERQRRAGALVQMGHALSLPDLQRVAKASEASVVGGGEAPPRACKAGGDQVAVPRRETHLQREGRGGGAGTYQQQRKGGGWGGSHGARGRGGRAGDLLSGRGRRRGHADRPIAQGMSSRGSGSEQQEQQRTGGGRRGTGGPLNYAG